MLRFWWLFVCIHSLRPTPYTLNDNAGIGPAKFVASLTIFATILALASKLDDMIKVEEGSNKDQKDNAKEDNKSKEKGDAPKKPAPAAAKLPRKGSRRKKDEKKPFRLPALPKVSSSHRSLRLCLMCLPVAVRVQCLTDSTRWMDTCMRHTGVPAKNAKIMHCPSI
jgi:hypothetical protein